MLLASSNPLLQWSYVTDNLGTIGSDLLQHVVLTVVAVGVGLAISLPAALLVRRFRLLRAPLLGFSALLYTIPSLALFVLVQPLTGYLSTTTAEVGLVSYTLLILIRNTVAGLEAVPADVQEATRALGYPPLAGLVRVELPLALPSIFAGLRVAFVTVVGLVNVTALIGQGGLGQLITYGFNDDYYSPIVVALVLSIALAAAGDGTLVAIERSVVRWSRTVRVA